MKIRTDFVTNSSSSSYCVEVHIKTKNDVDHSWTAPPYSVYRHYFDELSSDIDVSWSDVKAAKSIEELCGLLWDGIDLNGQNISELLDGDDDEPFGDETSYEDDYDPFCGEDYDGDDNYRGFIKERLAPSFARFKQELQRGVPSISDISRIRLATVFDSYGEASPCTVWNDPTLQRIARQVVSTVGEDHDRAVKKMNRYLLHPAYDEMANCWADYDNDKWVYDWSHAASSIDELARLIVGNGLSADDYGIEWYELNLETGKTSMGGRLILRHPGTASYDLHLDAWDSPAGAASSAPDFKTNDSAGETLIFEGKSFVTTGLTLEREEQVGEIVRSRGGFVKSAVSGKTDYLIVNTSYDYATVKYQKAQELIAKGKQITILSFDRFMELVE